MSRQSTGAILWPVHISIVESVSYCVLSLQLTIPVDITYICVLLHVMSKILPTSGHIGHNVAIYLCAPDTKLLGEVHYVLYACILYCLFYCDVTVHDLCIVSYSDIMYVFLFCV